MQSSNELEMLSSNELEKHFSTIISASEVFFTTEKMKHDFFNLLGKDEAEVCVYYGLGIDDYELTKVSSTDNFTKVHTRAKFTASGENYYNFVYIYVRVEVHEMNNKDSPELIMIMDLIYDHSLELRDVDYYYKLPI